MAGLIDNASSGTQKDPLEDVTTADATTYDPEKRTVDASKETVAGQLDSVLAADSPYIQRARARSAETANSRGLLNSSMAAGAGEAAAIDAALPIASSDANIYGTAARENQAAGNTALQFGANAKTTTAIQNAGSLNQAARQAQAGQIEAGLIGTRAASESQLQAERAGQEATLTGQKTEAESRLQSEHATQALTLEESQRLTQTALQSLRGDQATGLANIESNYRSLIQASASAGTLYKELVTGMTIVMGDTNTSPEQKQAAVDRLTQMLQSGLNVVGAIGNIDLVGLLDFTTPAAP